MQFSDKMKTFGIACVPPALALAAVALEPSLTLWSRGYDGVLPLATLLVMAALVHPRLRHLLMITLCYGVSFLALRDIGRVSAVGLPVPFNYESLEMLRPLGLLLVAGLAATAAIAESIQSGTVWARRCYFGASSLYFIGLGIINFAWWHSWQSVLLFVTGVTAGVGCAFAHRIVATEQEDVEDTALSDEMLQQAREAAHRARLQAREWKDTLASVIDERDSPSTGAI